MTMEGTCVLYVVFEECQKVRTFKCLVKPSLEEEEVLLGWGDMFKWKMLKEDFNILCDKNEEKLKSFNLGAVRILKGLDKEKNWQELSDFLANINSRQVQNIIGIGGNARQIIQAAGVLKDSLNLEELQEIRSRLGKLSLEEKVSDYNFPSDRADIIEHAANIFEFILLCFENAKFFASNWNISDGYIFKKNAEISQATSLEVS